MMASHEWKTVHYGIAGAQVPCETVDVLGEDEFLALRGPYDPHGKEFAYDPSRTAALYSRFMYELGPMLKERVQDGDVIALPFGHAHKDAALMADRPGVAIVETGIGYPDPWAPWRIYESYAWQAWVAGHQGVNVGNYYHWVIPNYYDPADWPFLPPQIRGYVLYLGRLIESKGLSVIRECAKALPCVRFVLCGQGEPPDWALTMKNVEYRPPVVGDERVTLFEGARAVIVPTTYVEPFGGVAVEAQMCGRPVVTTDYGAFPETVEDGVTGFRCHVLRDFLAGIDASSCLNGDKIRKRAIARYGVETVGKMYDRALRAIVGVQTGKMDWFG
jgi:glycosyltransferase involved in cell wall biosynthesis